MTDGKAIFRKLQDGDRTAFRDLFDEYAERLYVYAFGFMNERGAAEDIVQDVFIYLWENRRKIKLSGSLYAYLSRAVKNDCLNYKVRKKIEKRYFESVLNDQLPEDSETDDLEELLKKASAIISGLPERCREVFILGVADNLSYKDIAGKLGISTNTVKTQMKIAYRKIKESTPSLLFFLM